MSRHGLRMSAPNPHRPPPVPAAIRRELFGSLGAMLLLAAAEAGSGKAAELDGELLACCAEADALEAHAEALTEGHPPAPRCPWWDEADAMTEEAYNLRDRAINLPARTPEGLQAKAQVVLTILEKDGLASEMALSLARDVLGRAQA